jgi:hypothetical protein
MAAETDIKNGGFARMASLSTSLPISWPNVNFTPPATGLWFEIRHFPNDNRTLGMAADSRTLFVGAFQVSVYFRPGTGEVEPARETENVIAHFAKGTALGPVRVSARPSSAPAIMEDEFGFIPITIPYRGIA